MKIPYCILAVCSFCLNFGLHSDSNPNQPLHRISLDEITQLTSELSTAYKDGFQLQDIVTICSILDSYVTKNSTLSTQDKRQTILSLLNRIIDKQNLPAPEKQFLEEFTPALAFVIFPDSADNSLIPPTNPSPSEQEILTAIQNLSTTLQGKLSWTDIPSCVLFICQFASSYSGLTSQEKGFLAKKLLGEIIDKTDTPLLSDIIFDEVFKRIGYPLIDYLVSKN
ncbi:MAG: hypothetical protein JSS09_01830 [Verrucomicrobia bacterium]|nr:hypothetical protein [Verrucomicrobiota bacterium]